MSFQKLESSIVHECNISNRTNARSISWNASGTTLAMATADRVTRLYSTSDLLTSNSNSSGNVSLLRELTVVSGHSGGIDRVRFHSQQDSLLATTSGSDGTVRLWDLRSSSPKAVGKIDLLPGTGNGSTTDISWSPSTKASLLVVTEKHGTAHVLDTRKLTLSSVQTPTVSSNEGTKKSKSAPAFLRSVSLKPKIVDACIFSPSGDHLVAATSEEGYGELTVLNWEKEQSFKGPPDENEDTMNLDRGLFGTRYVYPAHTGPIYSMCFSPDGQRLATGGGDALVGLWDVSSMVCAATIPRCNRFVRSLSFSFDSQIVATSTEEGSVDLGRSDTGELVAKVSLQDSANHNTSRNRNHPGADEIAFHPKAHILACARCDSQGCSPLTVMRLTLGRS